MPFPFQIDILGMILKGVLIGIIASAPMGPVGVLCIQRTLNKGRWYGFVTGIGAAMSDIIYAMLTGFGMSFIMDLITNPISSGFRLAVALYCCSSVSIVSRPTQPATSTGAAPRKGL